MEDLFLGSIESKAQADGAQSISLGNNDRFREHTLSIEVSAQPTAGTLTVSMKVPGASKYGDLETIDLTAIATGSAKIVHFKGYAESVQFTPTGLDADKTYSVHLSSGAGS